MRKSLLWYIRFFSILCVCVLIFFALQLFAYRQFSDQLREEIVQKQAVYLSRGAGSVDEFFNVYQYSQFPAIQKLERLQKVSYRKLDKVDFAHLLTIRNDLQDIFGYRSADTPFFLFFSNNNGIAVTLDGIYTNLRDTLAKRTLSFNNMNYEDLMMFLQENASSGYTTLHANVIPFSQQVVAAAPERDSQTLVLVRNLHASSSGNSIYAMWLYKLDALRKAISNGSDTSDFFAVTFGGRLLYSSDPEVNLQQISENAVYDTQKKATYFKVMMPSVGIQAYLALDDEVVLSSLQGFSTLRNILLLSFFALALILLALVLFYFIRPLNRLYEHAVGGNVDRTKGNVFSQIERQLDELASDKKAVEQKLNQWNTLLHKNLLVRLMRGETLPPSAMEVLNGMPYAAPEHTFRVVSISCARNGSKALSNVREAFNQYMQEIKFPLYAWVYDTHAALVFPEEYLPQGTALEKNQALRGYLENLNRMLVQKLQLPEPLVITVGLEHADIRNLHLSFDEAKSAYHEAVHWHRSGVVFYEVYSTGPSLYSLTYEELGRLQNMLCAGDAEQACFYLDTLAARLVGGTASHPLEEWLMRQFTTEIRGVVLRVSVKRHEPSIFVAFPTIRDFVTLNEWLELAHGAFQYIGQLVHSTQGAEGKLSDELLDYISKYYQDSALSLATISEAFSMSERSMSRYFKDRMQDTFSNILEKYRLSEAEKLLLTVDSPLRIIAEQVGYANLSTFMKAFKRRYGVTPSEWAQQARKTDAAKQTVESAEE